MIWMTTASGRKPRRPFSLFGVPIQTTSMRGARSLPCRNQAGNLPGNEFQQRECRDRIEAIDEGPTEDIRIRTAKQVQEMVMIPHAEQLVFAIADGEAQEGECQELKRDGLFVDRHKEVGKDDADPHEGMKEVVEPRQETKDPHQVPEVIDDEDRHRIEQVEKPERSSFGGVEFLLVIPRDEEDPRIDEQDRQKSDRVMHRHRLARASGVHSEVPQPLVREHLAQFWSVKRSEERRVGKECRSRWSPYH